MANKIKFTIPLTPITKKIQKFKGETSVFLFFRVLGGYHLP